ncbi:MAG: response regulator [Rhodospirillaceae bacterium]|nr:response regulator [Rhodospirillaceae bacterium]
MAHAKILVVDDLAGMRTALCQALGKLGFESVTACADGIQALDHLKTNEVTLVISDWQMEPMDGLALLREVRGDARLKALPFILVSGEATPALRERANAAGASLVLGKPFGPEALRAALAGLSYLGVLSPE